MQLVEQTLSSSSSSTGNIIYLIGSTATVADVCVSVFLYRQFMAENPNHHVVLQPWMDVLLLRHHHFLDILHPLQRQRGEQQHQPQTQPSSPGLPSVDGHLALTPEECSANAILAALSHASIPYVAYTHTKCNTAEELVSNVPLPSSDHVHTKNLLFKDKKHGLFLVTTKADAPSSASDITKSLSKLVQGKANFRLASADTLKETLGVEPGCVGPLSLYKDTSSAITFVLDETLVSNNCSYIHSHPLINTISCMLRPQDLLQFITQVTKHEPIVLSLLIDATSASFSHDSTKANTGSSTVDNKSKKKGPSQPASTATAAATTSKVAAAKGETLLALQWKKHENFPNWYSDVIILSEMISYYNVSGCYILRPWSYKIWEIIQNWFNEQV
jgi:prolyl-tRNA synthetase